MRRGQWAISTAWEAPRRGASAWEIAHILGMPAVLVVDAQGASLSLMALIRGFLAFEKELGD